MFFDFLDVLEEAVEVGAVAGVPHLDVAVPAAGKGARKEVVHGEFGGERR